MSRKKDIDLDLTGFAELFMNDEGRAESRLPRIYGFWQETTSVQVKIYLHINQTL